MTLYQDSDLNKRKTWFLMTGFFVLVMLIGYAISWYFNSPIILIIAVAFSFVSSFVSYWWSDKIVLGMSNAQLVDHDNGREIYHLVENLCITAGLPVPQIYIIEDSAPNAFATGRDPKHAAIALTTGILAKLDKAELEGVIAHELSHIGNRDILISTVATVLVGTVILITDWSSRSAFWGRRDDNNNDSGWIGLILIIILSILAPLSAQLLQLAVSRKREFLADASGALLTRYPEGLARALEKISADPDELEVANRATAHMYIVSPLKGDDEGKKTSWLARSFMTHPPVEERIARLRGQEIK
jgi:Zn-dependent protease with chaperone function